jgi:hypothetical protein
LLARDGGRGVRPHPLLGVGIDGVVVAVTILAIRLWSATVVAVLPLTLAGCDRPGVVSAR